ncbi:MAG TPA: hypothetical protein VGN27_05830 [Gaiellaceae bacterium]|nr:hypothetical protein [Gaiellaceae bacterium]
MSTHDDEPIAFDFFDEPETVEATQRRRLPRLELPGGGRGGGSERPPRPPMRTPTGLVPLARLVGLIAIAIVIVVGLVFWVGSCQGKSKQGEYTGYVATVRTIAAADTKLGKEFANEFLASGLKQSELENKLQQFAQQEQQALTQAQQVRPPGPLRAIHQNLIDAIELRAKGLAALGDTLASPNALSAKSQTATTAKLTADGQLLTASDVVWAQLYQAAATQQLKQQGVTGVAIPGSTFIQNADFVSARSFGILVTNLGGASTGGTPSGLHGDALVSVQATPQNVDLSTSTATTIKVTPDLAFVVAVKDSGNFTESNVPIKVTITAGGSTIVKQQKLALIQAAATQTVKFTGFNIPSTAYGANNSTIKVVIAPVAGEINTANNSATYTVFFTLP